MKWPLVWRKNADAELQKERRRLMDVAEREMRSLVDDWRGKWEPLLKQSVALRAHYRPELSTFALTIAVDRHLMEMASMKNDEKIWEYISEQVSWEVRRQLGALNFSGLYKMAAENDRRYDASAYDQRSPYSDRDGAMSPRRR